MSVADGLERYACDRCHQRKLKCSRIKPTCNQCDATTDTCVYSRHGTLPRRTRQKQAGDAETAPANLTIEDRITRVESSIASLTSAIEKLTAGIERRDSPIQGKDDSHIPSLSENNSHHPLRFEPISLLGTTNGDVVTRQLDGMNLPGSAVNAASDLSETFAELVFDDQICHKVAETRHSRENFFVPNSIVGKRFLQIFLDTIDRFAPLFQRPPEALHQKIVFEPTAVRDRGWLILFYGALSTHFELERTDDQLLLQQLRWNTWLALDEGGLFLDPSIVKVQAFLLLATHAQGYSTPALSWTFINHACRMMQVLGLAGYCTVRHGNHEDRQYQRVLFWGVYAADRSLSLALGIPPAFNESICDRIPFLTVENVLDVNRRNLENYGSTVSIRGAFASSFGVRYIIQMLKFSKFIGKLLDSAYGSTRLRAQHPNQGSTRPIDPDFKLELDNWLNETERELSTYAQSDEDSSFPNASLDIRTGIAALRLQYHHVIVMLMRSDPRTKDQCVESARAVISLLQILVSNPTHVYNGIMWQLLYYPFTHFFVIFGHIISDPTRHDCSNDLGLLREAVSYFSQMTAYHQSAAKLEKIARVFTNLAEQYVSRGTNAQGQEFQHGMTEATSFPAITEPGSLPSAGNAPTWATGGGTEDLDATALPQPSSLLADFYTYHFNQSGSPSSVTSGNQTVPSVDDAAGGRNPKNEQTNIDTDSIMQSLGNHASKMPLDFSVDWLSLDRLDDDPLFANMDWN